MAKTNIRAKEAVADIRSGMDDGALMKKYGLSHAGLQSLFDKLVKSGFLDVGEMQIRLSRSVATFVVPETDLFPTKGGVKEQPSKDKASRMVSAQGAARDIRSGMDDAALMGKYGLSPRGLKSLIDKLTSIGLLGQDDLERRYLGTDERTVDLSEERLSFSDAIAALGSGAGDSSSGQTDAQHKESGGNDIAQGRTLKETALHREKSDERFQKVNRDAWRLENRWYDRPIILLLLLVCVFPLGFYALYRNSTLSNGIRAFITVSWIILSWVILTLTFWS